MLNYSIFKRKKINGQLRECVSKTGHVSHPLLICLTPTQPWRIT